MAIQFKSLKPEYGIMISVVGCTFIFYNHCKSGMNCGNGRKACRITSVQEGEYIKIILKITGVTFI